MQEIEDIASLEFHRGVSMASMDQATQETKEFLASQANKLQRRVLSKDIIEDKFKPLVDKTHYMAIKKPAKVHPLHPA